MSTALAFIAGASVISSPTWPITPALGSAEQEDREVDMDVLVNFFALRPTFTVLGLKIVWYIYLLNTLVQSYTSVYGIFQVLAQRGISWEAWSPNFIPLILGTIAQLTMVRVLMEVAATVLFSSRTET